MKSQTYMDRAMRSRDPRFARVLGKMGYTGSPVPPPPEDRLAKARADYESALGKRPYMGWDEATLRERITAAKAAPPPDAPSPAAAKPTGPDA